MPPLHARALASNRPSGIRYLRSATREASEWISKAILTDAFPNISEMTCGLTVFGSRSLLQVCRSRGTAPTNDGALTAKTTEYDGPRWCTIASHESWRNTDRKQTFQCVRRDRRPSRGGRGRPRVTRRTTGSGIAGGRRGIVECVRYAVHGHRRDAACEVDCAKARAAPRGPPRRLEREPSCCAEDPSKYPLRTVWDRRIAAGEGPAGLAWRQDMRHRYAFVGRRGR